MGKKTKVPKHIAGVKLPKPLRRALREVARTQNGKAVLTEALVGAAALLVAHEAQPGSKTRAMIAKKAPGAKAKSKALAAKALGWAGNAEAFQEAARAFSDSLRQRTETRDVTESPAPPISH